MSLLRRLSIQKKLLFSMGLCLLLFMAISSFLSVRMSSDYVRERVVSQELPAQVGEIRNDVLRQISQPLSVVQTMANDVYLQDWEDAGLPDSGIATFQRYAKVVKEKNKAASINWASASTGKYFTTEGLLRTLDKNQAADQWFYGLLAGDKAYTLDIDKAENSSDLMLYLNARGQTAGGKQIAAGLGLSINALADTIRSYKIGQTGHVYLARANGVLLVHRDTALADGKHQLKDLPGFSDTLGQSLLTGKKYAYAIYDAPAGRQFVAASFVPELNLYVMAEVPEAEVLGNVMRSALIAALIAGLVGGGIALCIIYVISRAIAAPVARAADMLSEIASGNGDLSRRMPVESEDEVGALAAAFNRFVIAERDDTRSSRQYGLHCQRIEPDRVGQPGPVGAHGSPGVEPGRDGGGHGRTHVDRETECGQRAPGQSARGVGLEPRRQGRRGGGTSRADDGRDYGKFTQDRRHYRGDRRHCLSNQHPRPERGRRGGPCGRTGPRFCRGGNRGAQLGATLGSGSERNQGLDRRLGQQAGRLGRRHHAGHRRLRAKGGRPDGRNRLGQPGTKPGYRASQCHRHADG